MDFLSVLTPRLLDGSEQVIIFQSICFPPKSAYSSSAIMLTSHLPFYLFIYLFAVFIGCLAST